MGEEKKSRTIRALAAGRGLKGEVIIPGDKSVSHRSIMFGAMSESGAKTHITNFLESADCLSTVAVWRSLGAKIERLAPQEMLVTGLGLHGLKEPAAILDAGNSGTTLRLMLGVLAGRPFFSAFSGDASLTRRPMGRVITPLRQMGAKIVGRGGDKYLPIAVLPFDRGEKLTAIEYRMPVASAQVKSAILLAGLRAAGPTTVIEPYTSRDHTEKLLLASGVRLEKTGSQITLYPPEKLSVPAEISVPGDISSAAFWLVAASIIENSELLLKGVGLNETRTGILDVLKAMGAHISVENERRSGGEPIADLRVSTARLKATTINEEIMPRLIDEIPIIAVACLLAEGTTTITGAGELRVKETDRLQAIVDELNRVAPGHVEGTADGLIIKGIADRSELKPARCQSYGDHRIAMALSILGCAVDIEIDDAACVNISYPKFYDTLEKLAPTPIRPAPQKVIAIDGPAGAGKSTLAKRVAKKLGYIYIDTGAMYRAVAYKALTEANGAPLEESAIIKAAAAIDIKLGYHPDGSQWIAVDGRDVSREIRTPEVTAVVSKVAALPAVREKLTLLQQNMAKSGSIIMDGRDIASHVLPNADVKIYLTASLAMRARRRSKELAAGGYEVNEKQIEAEIAARDKADSERKVSPLVRVPEAVLLDTTDLDLDAAEKAIRQIIDRS